MGNLPTRLIFMLLSWGAITAVLLSLLAYRATLARNEDDSLRVHKGKYALPADQQEVVIAKMNWLRRPIVTLATLSGSLLIATASMWAWTQFTSF